MMTAARLVVMLALGILAAPLAVEAQSPGKIPRIGVLAAGIPTTYTSRYEAFRQGLREFGYVEGQTIIMEYRYAEGKFERLAEVAAELVRLKVDLIVASSAPETAAAKQATTSIPIVFARHSDAVGAGHLASLAKPGGNVTGVSAFGPELAAKRVEMLKEAFSPIARVAVLWNAANPAKRLDWQETQGAARALGLTLQAYEVRRPEDVASAFAAMTKQRPDALLTLPDPLLLNSRAWSAQTR